MPLPCAGLSPRSHPSGEARIHGTLILAPGGDWRFVPFSQDKDGAWLSAKEAKKLLEFQTDQAIYKIKHLLIHRRVALNKGMEFRLDSLLAYKATR